MESHHKATRAGGRQRHRATARVRARDVEKTHTVRRGLHCTGWYRARSGQPGGVGACPIKTDQSGAGGGASPDTCRALSAARAWRQTASKSTPTTLLRGAGRGLSGVDARARARGTLTSAPREKATIDTIKLDESKKERGMFEATSSSECKDARRPHQACRQDKNAAAEQSLNQPQPHLQSPTAPRRTQPKWQRRLAL